MRAQHAGDPPLLLLRRPGAERQAGQDVRAAPPRAAARQGVSRRRPGRVLAVGLPDREDAPVPPDCHGGAVVVRSAQPPPQAGGAEADPVGGAPRPVEGQKLHLTSLANRPHVFGAWPSPGSALGGDVGGGLLAFVWTAAAVGAAHAFFGEPGRREGVAVLLYLLLGWCGVVLVVPLSAALSTGALALLAAGGVLYSAGTAFHLAARLPYHNAAWHAFVLGAAACHFAAVLRDIAPAG